MTADGLFDPHGYARQRLPLERAYGLPAACYTAPEFFAREAERLFRPSWRLVGREDEFTGPGAFRTLDTAAGPIAVIRGRDGALRAFLNSCRHRGALLLDGHGDCTAVVCPYHAWSYGLDGALIAAPGMDRAAGFDRRGNGLVPVRLEAWGGFAFVNADAEAPGLLDSLGDLPEVLAPYRFAEMKCVRRAEFDVACNWKLLAENAMEEYHTGTVHRASLGQQQGEAVATRGDWDALYIRQDTTIAVLPGEASPLPHVPDLPAKHAQGTFFTMIYPALQFACTQDCMWWLDFQPRAVDHTRVSVGFAFPKSTTLLPAFPEAVKAYYRRWDISIGEDNAIGERQQRGMAALGRPPGRLSHKEHHVHKLANWVLDRVLD